MSEAGETVKPTVLDEGINAKVIEYVEADEATRAAESEYRRLQRESSEQERELQKLLIARSVLRDGGPYGAGDANSELYKLKNGFQR